MPLPRVSVITPTYNHEKFITDCIESVISQTYRDWEMIIVDDGSKDGTRDIILNYKDPRIILVSQEHRGVDFLGENYNCGFLMARGEFIMVVEGDDFIPPNRLEIQLAKFKDDNVVLSHGKYAYVFDGKTVVYPSPFEMNVLKNRPVGSALKAFLQGFNPIGAQSVMIRKQALQEIGGFTQPRYLPLTDYPTWMKLALKGPFEFIPEVLGYWRRHPLSVTMNLNSQIFEGFLRYCDEFANLFDRELRPLGLEEFIKNRGAIGCLSLSWMNLSNRNWINALRLAQKSWDRHKVLSWPFKMKTIIAIISAYLHVDIPSHLKKSRQMLYTRNIPKVGESDRNP